MRPAKRTALLSLLVALMLVGVTGAALASKSRSGSDDSDDSRGRGHEALAKCLEKAEEGSKKAEKASECREKLKAKLEKRGNKWLVRNEDISVWFHTSKHGEKAKPHLKVFWTGEDGNKTGYEVKILRLFEIDTANGTDYRGEVARMDLERADDWNVQVTEAGDGLTLRMTRAEAQGVVTLVWYLNATSKAIKFDLIVENWKWGADAADHRLGLDMLVKSKGVRDLTNGSASLDAGYVTWAETAEATYANGSKGTLTVGHAAYREDDDDQHIVLVFNGPGGYRNMVYDPSFGVIATQSAGASPLVPGPALVGTVLAVAAAAGFVAVTRRRA